MNVDFEDVNTVLRQSGVAIMGIGYAEGETRAQDAVDQALASPLLEDNVISGAQNILLNICSGEIDLTMDEIDRITHFVQEEAGSQANLIWGNCYDETLEKGISVTVIATGFKETAIQAIAGNSHPSKTVVDLKTPAPVRMRPASGNSASAPAQPLDPNFHEFDSPHPRVKKYNDAMQYREDVMRDMHRQENREPTPVTRDSYAQQRPVHNESLPPSNPDELAHLEREPALLRYRRQRGLLPSQKAPAHQPSRTVVDHNGEPRLGGDNPWLYDKAD